MRWFILALILWPAASAGAADWSELFEFTPREGGTARAAVDAARRAERPLNRLLLGKFAEHLGRNIYHGMWAQLVRNPDFESAEFWSGTAQRRCEELAAHYETPELSSWARRGLPPCWAAWRGEQMRYAAEPKASGLGQCLRMDRAGGGETLAGVRQPLDLPFQRQRSYEWSLYARADRAVKLTVRLRGSGEAELAGEASVSLPPGDWRRLSGRIDLPSCDPPPGGAFVLEIGFRQPAAVRLDQCLVFPADNQNGWDCEVVRMVKESKLPLLRWPGGNFASGYHWKDGIGPLRDRPMRRNRPWRMPEPNHVGTDEFMQFCKLVGCEPMICVNAGDGTAEEAADWVEYCNGSADSPMGRLRAANGHPDPYGVRYWEVGNELYGAWQIGHCTAAQYAQRYRRFAQAMKERDPRIRLIANGNDLAWNRELVDQCADCLQSVSLHTLVGGGMPVSTPPIDVWRSLAGYPWEYRNRLLALSEQLRERVPGGKLAITELQIFTNRPNLPNNGGLAEALFWAGIVHTALRAGDRVELITHSALVNHGGGLRKVSEVLYPNPVYLARRLYSTQPGRWPVAVRLEGPALSTPRLRNLPAVHNAPLLDLLALTDDDNRRLVLLAINRSADDALPAEIRLEHFTPAPSARREWISGESILASNSPQRPDAVRLRQEPLRIGGPTFRLRFPARSVSAIRLERK